VGRGCDEVSKLVGVWSFVGAINAGRSCLPMTLEQTMNDHVNVLNQGLDLFCQFPDMIPRR
jgi:hypothetical protein